MKIPTIHLALIDIVPSCYDDFNNKFQKNAKIWRQKSKDISLNLSLYSKQHITQFADTHIITYKI